MPEMTDQEIERRLRNPSKKIIPWDGEFIWNEREMTLSFQAKSVWKYEGAWSPLLIDYTVFEGPKVWLNVPLVLVITGFEWMKARHPDKAEFFREHWEVPENLR